ncbi:hypothetical protein [Fusobacterium sp. PH5-44]|uniref:hypothetical protein n=1 Tax=unclassified Fusobacterium TaxID=2648384 RepID=UPI003D1B0441
MKTTIRIYNAVMQGKDGNFSFSADYICIREYSEEQLTKLQKEYAHLAKEWRTQYLLEIIDRRGKLIYFEKIKPSAKLAGGYKK